MILGITSCSVFTFWHLWFQERRGENETLFRIYFLFNRFFSLLEFIEDMTLNTEHWPLCRCMSDHQNVVIQSELFMS